MIESPATDFVEQKSKADGWEEKYNKLVEAFAKKLSPCTCDEVSVMAALDGLLSRDHLIEDKEREIKQKTEQYREKLTEFNTKLLTLDEEWKQKIKQDQNMLARNEKLRADVSIALFQVKQNYRLFDFIHSLRLPFTIGKRERPQVEKAVS